MTRMSLFEDRSLTLIDFMVMVMVMVAGVPHPLRRFTVSPGVRGGESSPKVHNDDDEAYVTDFLTHLGHDS